MPKVLNPLLLSRSVQICLVGIAIFLVSACNSSKYLADNEYLIKKNKIELEEGATVEEWRAFQLEMLGQVVTKPNGSFFLFFPREWFYLKGTKRTDTTRFSSFVRRIIAEEPAYLTLDETYQSVTRLRTFMLNRGYFDATVSATADTLSDHKVKVKYTVSPGEPYRYADITYSSDNPVISQFIQNSSEERLIKAGDRVDSREYDAEVLRIVNLLRNNGFANFYSNSISPVEADSTGHLVNGAIKILPPAEEERHQTYRIGKITVFPDTDPLATSTTVSIDTSYDGLRFIYSENEMVVKPATIAENIFFRTGEVFNQDELSKTNLQLNNLNVFRFVTIQQVASTDEENEIDFLIQLSRVPKWDTGGSALGTFSDRQAVSGGRLNLIGGEVSYSLSNRNLLGGAEQISFSLNAGLEFNLNRLGDPTVQRLNTVEFGGGITYGLPRFVDYFGLYRGLNQVKSGETKDGKADHFIPDEFYQALRERGTSRLKLSASYVSLLNFNQTTTLSSVFGYDVSPRPGDRYTINHIGFDYFRLVAGANFIPILDQTPYLRNSLSDQVFSALILRNISFSRKRPGKTSGSIWTLLADFEQSGFEAFLANKITNEIQGNDNIFSIGQGTDYARYVRALGSSSLNLEVGPRQNLVFRGLIGSALTFGYNRRVTSVPYVRQFFGGGNTSLRGWNARAVGPGGYRDALALSSVNIANFQQADFKLEMNAEYRSFLTNISTTKIEGAIFLDAGNIWTLANDPTRPGSQFRFTELKNETGEVINEPFYKQIAMNTGFGLRWDISYVILRLDVGVKLRNPYKIIGPEGGPGTYFPKRFSDDEQRRLNYTIGLNYPF